MAGQSFDHLKPPPEVHNPTALAVSEFPRHVHKFAGVHTDGSPKLNHFKVVQNTGEFEAALAEGWSATPVLEKAKRAPKPDPQVPTE